MDMQKNISIVENSKKIYRAAGYIRLSVIKDSQNRDSIENQKAIINDALSGKSDIELQQFYVADISRKTQASIDRNIHDGKCVAARAPYGYAKSISDCHQLVVDPEAAAVVKEIFAMAKEKLSLNEIVRRLNLASIPTPADYALSNARQGNFEQGDGFWNSRTVKYILTNRTYTGDLQQGKDEIIVENTHEALVSREVFLRIQENNYQRRV